MPNVIAVEHVGMHAAMEQVAFKRLSDGRFPGARKSSQPNHCSLVTGPDCPFTRGDFSFGPKDILAFCNGAIRVDAAENRSATADLSVVYDDEPSEVRNAVVVVDDEWSTGLDCKPANLVSL